MEINKYDIQLQLIEILTLQNEELQCKNKKLQCKLDIERIINDLHIQILIRLKKIYNTANINEFNKILKSEEFEYLFNIK